MAATHRNRYQLKTIYKAGKSGMDLSNIKGVAGTQVLSRFEAIVAFGPKTLRKIGTFLKKHIVDSLHQILGSYFFLGGSVPGFSYRVNRLLVTYNWLLSES